MSKTYTLTSTKSLGGNSPNWDGSWNNFTAESTRQCGLRAGYYRATYYMFDAATLAHLRSGSITINRVVLSISVTGGTGIPSGTSDLFAVRAKGDNTESKSTSWQCELPATNLSFINQTTTTDIDLTGKAIPAYGYVLGPNSPSYSQVLELGSSATLTVETNETDYSYTLVYNANSGSGAPSQQTGSNTGTSPSYTFTISNTSPTRTGYNFLGWSKSSSATSASYSPGGTITVTSSGTTTLYAVWEKKTYTISYNANGGTGAPASQTKTYGQALTLQSGTPSRSSASAGNYTVTYNVNGGNALNPSSVDAARTTTYTFKNWNTASGGGGTSYNPSDSYTANAAATMYAQWNSSTTTASITLATPTKTGYTCNGWYTAASGGSKVGNAGASYTPTGNITLYAQWTATVVAPTFTTQPSSKSVYRGASTSLSVAATTSQGTITYQWQNSSNNSTWSNISGATSTSYTTPTTTVGTVYYRCVATATKDGVSQSTNSNAVSVVVNATPTPTITTQPSGKSVNVGETASLSVSASVASGTLSYQWYSSADGSTWSAISGATSSSYSAPTSSAGTTYYKVRITNSLNGYTAYTDSTTVSVGVANVSTPTFTKNPQSASYAYGVTANPLTVSATSNGTITYQWQSSSNNSNWSNISGATAASYTPPTTPAGVKYYRCVATATGGSQTQTANSASASITVVTASAPVFTYDLSTIDATYNAGDVATALNGTATVVNGTVAYQWYKSTDSGSTWYPIMGAESATYQPPTTDGGTAYYKVVATNIVGTSTVSATSGSAKVTVQNVILDYDAKWAQYINSVGKPFVKLARLDFLNPNGSVLYSLDNNPRNSRSGAFIQSGEIVVNLQNGSRRTATVTLSNLDGEFDYNVNKLWFGQQVRLWEGMILPNGSDFYISQGVFYVKDPIEVYEPNLKQTTLNLVDKWAYLDGTLFGNLDGTYEVPLNSNIFNAIQSVLNLDRGNGQKVDASVPIFTNYYNGKTTTLPDGSTVPLTNTPYTYRCDGENGTYADIILELNTMLAGWIGYDANGQLRLDPSQDDILDTTKPIQWQFSPNNSTFLGATYSVKNSEVYNDIIIIGESLSKYGQTAGRATNYDPKSDTNANIIGLKTVRYQQSGYYTQDICESLAVFKLKRETVLKKSVSIKCSQMFHLQENNLVTIERTDKYGNPIERHLITGYTRPIAQNGQMVINATSVMDQPVATISTAP